MNPTTQTGESPVRHHAESSQSQAGATYTDDMRDATLLAAVSKVATQRGLQTVELLKMWSPYQ